MPDPVVADGTVFDGSLAYLRDRVAESIGRIPRESIAKAVGILLKAPATFVYGAGRSGIIGRAFAMRLVQVGLTAYVIGESVTPIVRRGDAVFILSGRGESYSSIQTANIVRREGAELVAHTATLLMSLELPEEEAQRKFAPLGTLFESASLQLTDALVAELMAVRGETEGSMRRRHAIMV
jgi:6-phospho-3-hexuloisomerase